MNKYKKHYLAGYIEDLWFIVRKLRDLKSEIINYDISPSDLTEIQSKLAKFIPKLEHKLKQMERHKE